MKNPFSASAFSDLIPYAKQHMKRLRGLSGKPFPYETLITVEISRNRLLHNLNQFRTLAPGGMIAPVLKSNAYGHGLFEIAEILEGEAVPFFVVDSYFEAAALRARSIKKSILIVGYVRPETMLGSNIKNISFAITDIETLRSLAKLMVKVSGKPLKKMAIQVKVDTGMRRQGILPEEIKEAVSIIKKNNRAIEVEGTFTHFSDADNSNPAFTEKQIEIWNRVARTFKMEFPDIKYIHASATDSHRFSKKIDANMSRLGLGLYGLSDDMEFARKMDLLPVLSMKTILTGLKPLKAGETTGYGNSFSAWKDTTIATIPVGYFEGLNRKLSNNGSVIVIGGAVSGSKLSAEKNHIVCPIVGRVSMNITTIEIPAGANASAKTSNGAPAIMIGTPVIAISDNPRDQNSLHSIAKKTGTTTYEIAVHIPAHLKRMVV